MRRCGTTPRFGSLALDDVSGLCRGGIDKPMQWWAEAGVTTDRSTKGERLVGRMEKRDFAS
jgi:hypothetical protein